jgi:hypothetical protein
MFEFVLNKTFDNHFYAFDLNSKNHSTKNKKIA